MHSKQKGAGMNNKEIIEHIQETANRIHQAEQTTTVKSIVDETIISLLYEIAMRLPEPKEGE